MHRLNVSKKQQNAKANVRLCSNSLHDISVFEQQIALINSSTLSRTYPRAKYSTPNNNRYMHSPLSSNSTLIASSSPQCHKPKVSRAYSIQRPRAQNKAVQSPVPTSSIHLRIPMNFLVEVYRFVSSFVGDFFDQINQSYEENAEFVLNILAIGYLSGFLTFGTEILELRRNLFIVGLILVGVAGYIVANDHNSYILLRGSTINVLESQTHIDEDTKSLISHIGVGFQILLLCSLFRLTSLFKNQYMNTNSRLDHLSLIILGSYMIFVATNLFQHSIQSALHFSGKSKYKEDPPEFLQTAVSSFSFGLSA